MTEIAARNRPRPLSAEQSGKPTVPSRETGYAHITRTNYGNQHDVREEVVVPVFNTAPARVRVGGSVTRNLGDFNSARVEVMVEYPCLPEQSEIERVYRMASIQVDEMIRRELEIATGVGDETSPPSIQPSGPPSPSQAPTPGTTF